MICSPGSSVCPPFLRVILLEDLSRAVLATSTRPPLLLLWGPPSDSLPTAPRPPCGVPACQTGNECSDPQTRDVRSHEDKDARWTFLHPNSREPSGCPPNPSLTASSGPGIGRISLPSDPPVLQPSLSSRSKSPRPLSGSRQTSTPLGVPRRASPHLPIPRRSSRHPTPLLPSQASSKPPPLLPNPSPSVWLLLSSLAPFLLFSPTLGRSPLLPSDPLCLSFVLLVLLLLLTGMMSPWGPERGYWSLPFPSGPSVPRWVRSTPSCPRTSFVLPTPSTGRPLPSSSSTSTSVTLFSIFSKGRPFRRETTSPSRIFYNLLRFSSWILWSSAFVFATGVKPGWVTVTPGLGFDGSRFGEGGTGSSSSTLSSL